MPVRLGGSYLLDLKTGELTPNVPADEAGDTHTEARAGGIAEGQLAQPEPITGALASDEPVTTLVEPAPVPVAETGEASEAAPAAASDTDNNSSARRKANKKDV